MRSSNSLDIVGRQPIEPHDERAQRIAVGDDDDVLAGRELRRDALLEEGNHALSGVFQAFASGRGDVVRALPEVDLLGSPAPARLVLVDAHQLAIVALVERRILHRGDVFLIELVENDLQRMRGARQRAGEGGIEAKTSGLEHGAGAMGLEQAFLGEAHIL